jgi:catechol 2,3-dioxygenase-like lactoylglutathione lyase family enzyme
MRIQHVGLVVSDLDRSRAFYAGPLGLEEVPRPANFTFDGAWFRFGGTEVHLLSDAHATGGAGQPDPGAGKDRGMTHHLAFEVDDLDAACARLAEHGVELEGGPMPRGDGYVQVFFLDPDGHVLELFQLTGEDQSDAPERAPVQDGRT